MDRYVSAARLEPYRDGLLLEALETAPELRGRGYAAALLRNMLESAPGTGPVYSHVDKKNAASLAVHRACGFRRILEHAVYADGSVLASACTLCYPRGKEAGDTEGSQREKDGCKSAN